MLSLHHPEKGIAKRPDKNEERSTPTGAFSAIISCQIFFRDFISRKISSYAICLFTFLCFHAFDICSNVEIKIPRNCFHQFRNINSIPLIMILTQKLWFQNQRLQSCLTGKAICNFTRFFSHKMVARQ